MLNRWLKLWMPYDRKMVIHAIALPNGSRATSPSDKADALAQHWSKVFSKRPIDTRLAQALSRQFSNKIDLADTTIPSESNITNFLGHARHSATGPDGILYCAWAATAASGARTLRLVLVEMLNGQDAPDGFNHSLANFPPKGIQEGDEEEVERTAEDTRPLNIKKRTTGR
jgi:hypothetical protein